MVTLVKQLDQYRVKRGVEMFSIQCVVIFAVVFNFICAEEFTTYKNTKQHKFFPVSGNELHFKVRAHNDALLALSPRSVETDQLTEIIIGGWDNTNSQIRRKECSKDYHHAHEEKETLNFLKEDEFRSFWVTWDKGVVTVRRDGDSSPFLTLSDPEPINIRYAGVHSGYGSKGIWNIKDVECDVVKGVKCAEWHLETEGNIKKYQFFELAGKTLRFTVRTANDAYIGLASQPWETDPMYAICIGGWNNTRSAIRRGFCVKNGKNEMKTFQYLNDKEFRGFWVRWDHGLIQVGREGSHAPFLSWRDPEPFDVTHVGLRTGSDGTWQIENVSNETKNALNEVKTDSSSLLYTFFPVFDDSIEFQLLATTDAHIALTTHERESNPMYEIVIGGWGNKGSEIRRRTCVAWERDIAITPQIVSPDESRGFWISWSGGHIRVGREGEDLAFMTFRDPEPLPVKYVGIHTGFGSTGYWEIDGLNVNGGYTFPVVTPGDSGQYQFHPTTRTSVKFQLRTTTDAHIALSADSQDADPMYEIVIGGWAASKSVIRRKGCWAPQKYEVATPQYLNENEYRGFWVKWDNGKVQVGKDGETKPFISWKDVYPLPVAFVGVHTGFGSTGSWKITNASRNDAEERVETGDNTVYQYFPVSGKSFKFQVKARNDAHIGLSANPWDTDPMYEIVIGGWENAKSVLRRLCCFPPERDNAQTPEILGNGGFRGFWLRWDGGFIRAGREGEAEPFVKWQDPAPFPVNYLGVHTGFGSSGIWKFRGKISTTPVGTPIQDVPVQVGVPLQASSATPVQAGCKPTLTRLRQGTACAGQVIFEDNFDTLREDVWQVQQYVPIDHPELPFVSYQRSTVSVTDGQLRIIPALQQIQPGFTHYSMYGALDLYSGCTSGQSSSCRVEASDGYTIIPPIIGGRIISRSNFAFTYGIITIRAKLPQGDWLYPEILLEPVVKKFVYGSQNSGMIKIACARGNKDLSKGSTQYGNKVLFSGPVIDTKCHETLLVTKMSDKAWGDDFHDYTVKWTPERLIMSVDGEEYARVESASGGLRSRLPKTCPGPQQTGMAPFDEHYYITLGLAAGGHTQFPDGTKSNNHAKPWRNHASKATLNFWQDIDSWHDTWNQMPKLLVAYVKVIAL